MMTMLLWLTSPGEPCDCAWLVAVEAVAACAPVVVEEDVPPSRAGREEGGRVMFTKLIPGWCERCKT